MTFVCKSYKSLSVFNNKKKLNILNSKKNYQEIIKPLNGLEVSIPIGIFSDVYTNLHYGKPILDTRLICLQLLIGYFTYGRDRYKDALEYQQIDKSINKIDNNNKIQLYNVINENQKLYLKFHTLSFSLIMSIFLYDDYWYNNIIFILLLISTEFYKDLKINYGFLKPIYVSFMWTVSTLIVPSVIYDHDFSILNYPLDYLPIFLIILGTSNIADIKDIKEDKKNKVNTLASILGEKNSVGLALFCLALSSYLFGTNQHYLDRPIINTLLELQNIGTTLSLLPYINNYTNYTI